MLGPIFWGSPLPRKRNSTPSGALPGQDPRLDPGPVATYGLVRRMLKGRNKSVGYFETKLQHKVGSTNYFSPVLELLDSCLGVTLNRQMKVDDGECLCKKKDLGLVVGN